MAEAVVATTLATTRGPLAAGERLRSIDILRGLVIALMALDHVRDFLHYAAYQFDPLDAGQTNFALYLTRWLTHFCAPTFVFLAGVSAWLQAAKGKSPRELSRFLLTRGLWLFVLELTVIGFAWSFSIPFMQFLQVIWAIGISMVVLAGLVWLPRAAVLAIGLAVIAGHNLLDPITSQQLGKLGTAWMLIHDGGVLFSDGAPSALIAYPVLPWLGVMALGYGLGAVFQSPRRDRVLVLVGAGMIVAFFALRLLNGYGNPQPWGAGEDLRATLMRFFNVQKYPPSLMFVCITLGPVLLLTPLLERWRGWLAEVFRTFGAVPLFAYVLHAYIAHLLALAVNAALGNPLGAFFNFVKNIVFNGQALSGTGVTLPFVYLGWLGVLALLYPMCRWWARVRATRRTWWMSYL